MEGIEDWSDKVDNGRVIAFTLNTREIKVISGIARCASSLQGKNTRERRQFWSFTGIPCHSFTGSLSWCQDLGWISRL
ncbi:uncharacterized protein L203_104137 [Cryptococcus depauperatus CBS 7841]|uniref:Uncharacterized protein n=1 Tax=Cryptococcus depauperatus CBS 7841 TaxID=1295531 RepID=A0AAJ8M2P9_9TREE